jgi:hypothetical protein
MIWYYRPAKDRRSKDKEKNDAAIATSMCFFKFDALFTEVLYGFFVDGQSLHFTSIFLPSNFINSKKCL